jgi:hypothetical protein
MDRKLSFKIVTMLMFSLALLSSKLVAQDQIKFTWYTIGEKNVTIRATDGGIFTVNWGDGTETETKIGSMYNEIELSHNYDNAAEYEVVIKASTINCKFTSFKCCIYTSGWDFVNNQISSLSLTGCASLVELRCGGNYLSNLDLSSCIALRELDCAYNQLSSIDLTNCVDLDMLVCYNNQLTSLDISKNKKLGLFYCWSNQLTNLELNDLNIGYFDCYNNKLTNLNIRNCSIYSLGCSSNQLEDLDLSTCSNLGVLRCDNNELSILDLSTCPDLKYFNCDYNQLRNLKLNSNMKLQSVTCYENQLQLSDLFAIHLLASDESYNYLGTQRLQPQWATIGTELFTDQSVFGGIFTNYEISKNGNPAPENDYTISDSKVTFNAIGIYTVTMTNDAIVSVEYFPAKVIVEIDVRNVGVSENNSSSIKLYPNPTNNKIYIKLENGIEITPELKLYSIEGRLLKQTRNTEIDLSGYSQGTYFLSVDGEMVKIVRN